MWVGVFLLVGSSLVMICECLSTVSCPDPGFLDSLVVVSMTGLLCFSFQMSSEMMMESTARSSRRLLGRVISYTFMFFLIFVLPSLH